MSWFPAEKSPDAGRNLPGHHSLHRGARQSGRVAKVRLLVLPAVILIVGGGVFLLQEEWGFGTEPEPPYDGYRYEAIGDSITFGLNFNFTVDAENRPSRTARAYQGWPDLLGEMLTKRTGVNTSVLNEGHPGDRLVRLVNERIPAIIKVRRHADAALVLIGTIDSNDFNSTPSGEGCQRGACDGTYKGELLEVVSKLRKRGRESIHIALIPPVWGPDSDSLYTNAVAIDAERNLRIKEYNRVITNEIVAIPGVKLGPDFFSCFLSADINRFSLFYDHLHPNALGNLVMATLWLNAIVDDSVGSGIDQCPSPVYILESLDSYRHGHKQNLLVEGDSYYVDESFALTNVPDELSDGIWVLQANADRENRDPGFLSFDAGVRPVTVYVAYDPAGDPPTSASHRFAPHALSSDLAVSDQSVGAFAIVRATDVTGPVIIGGNKSGDSPLPQQGYIVIVVP
jgi:lysophospholipase L1-like esterase